MAETSFKFPILSPIPSPLDKVWTVDTPFAKIIGDKKVEPQIAEPAIVEVEEAPVLTGRAGILQQHGGLESNIPVNSPYWKMNG